MAKIDAFFQLMHDQGASDLHLVTGQQPALRIRGEVERIKFDLLTNDGLKAMLYEITPEHKVKQFEETGDVDFAYEIRGLPATARTSSSSSSAAQRSSVRFRARSSPPRIWACPRSSPSWLPSRGDWSSSPDRREAASRRRSRRSSTRPTSPGRTTSSRSRTRSNSSTRARAAS